MEGKRERLVFVFLAVFTFVVLVLKECGKTMFSEELHEAAKEGDVDVVVRLVDEEGVDVNSKDEVCVLVFAHLCCCLGQNEITTLIWSSCNGHLNVAQLLLDRGANPLIKNRVSRVCL